MHSQEGHFGWVDTAHKVGIDCAPDGGHAARIAVQRRQDHVLQVHDLGGQTVADPCATGHALWETESGLEGEWVLDIDESRLALDAGGAVDGGDRGPVPLARHEGVDLHSARVADHDDSQRIALWEGVW